MMKLPDGVWDNEETGQRERWIDGEVFSSFPKEEVEANKGTPFPWGAFPPPDGEKE
jgi:hypothetical protein